MRIKRIEEFKISAKYQKQIVELLSLCFSEYPGKRTYYKQLPDFRYLVWEDSQLIGHLGVEHRKIKVGNTIATIFGVCDLCINAQFQAKGIASQLLKELEKLGQKHHIDFIILNAQEHELYLKNGFQLVKNTLRWVMINEHQTLGVGHRTIENSLLVKAISKKEWNDGLVDFLGHIF